MINYVIDCILDETLNLPKDGFVIGKDEKVLPDPLNPLIPLNIDGNLNVLINDFLAI